MRTIPSQSSLNYQPSEVLAVNAAHGYLAVECELAREVASGSLAKSYGRQEVSSLRAKRFIQFGGRDAL